jgi:repressor LexA
MGRKPLLTKEKIRSMLQRWIVERGMPPTVEELRGALHVGSTRTVHRYLRALEEDGDIERWPGARGIRLRRGTTTGLYTRAVPVVGEAPAGPLMTAEQNIEGYVRFPKSLLRPERARFFLLRVRGDSMNLAEIGGNRIESGDLILVKQQATAETGQIVVALIDGEATIKRLLRKSGYWLLKPESTNPRHQPIVFDAAFRAQGVVTRILKKGSDLLRTIGEQS